jgi:hypothetical protein
LAVLKEGNSGEAVDLEIERKIGTLILLVKFVRFWKVWRERAEAIRG